VTRPELEARRLQAIPDLQNGTRMSQLAKQYQVSRTTIYRWQHKLEHGESLKATKAPGRPPKLAPSQKLLLKGIFRNGLKEGRWTQKAFGTAIENATGIKYSKDHVGRIMHQLGLTAIRHHEARP